MYLVFEKLVENIMQRDDSQDLGIHEDIILKCSFKKQVIET
jgi:hypothetical protein